MRLEAINIYQLRDPAAGDHRFDGSFQNVVVEVVSECGLRGIGETDAPPSVVQALVEMPDYNNMSRGLASVLIGQTLDHPIHLWQLMYQSTQWHGRVGAAIHAISALDIAIWDLFAQGQGKPIWACLGQNYHQKFPVYATLYPLSDHPEGIKEQLEPLLSQGLRHFKICVDPWWVDLALVTDNLRFLRQWVGADISLMLDVALAWTELDQLRPVLPLLAELNFRWIEAPFPLTQLSDHVQLKKMTDIPIGVGDLGMTGCQEFLPYLAADAFDIAQPDLTLFGGLTEAMRLAALLKPRQKLIIPHGYNSDITIATNLHFLAVQPASALIEYSTSSSLLRKSLAPGLSAVDKEGMIAVPQTAGLGVRLDPTILQRTRSM